MSFSSAPARRPALMSSPSRTRPMTWSKALSFICCAAAAWPACAECPRAVGCLYGRCSPSGEARSPITSSAAASRRCGIRRTPTMRTRAFASGATRSNVAAAPEPVGAEMMRQLYARAGGAQPSLSRAHLASMLRLAQAGPGGRGVDLPGGLRFRIVGQAMQIVAPDSDHRPAPRLEVSACDGCGDIGAAHLRPGLELHLGHRTPGLTMRPLM